MMTNGDTEIKVVPVRHYGQWFGAAVAAVLVAMLIHTLLSKVPVPGQYTCHVVDSVRKCRPEFRWRFYWNIVGQYFTSSEILHGLVITLILTVLAMTVGIVLGVFIAVMRLSSNRLLSMTAWSYTWFFRGTPVYAQLLFWFNIAALFKVISFGVPFVHIAFFKVNMVTFFTPFRAALVGLGLNEAAYMSEVARSGLISVDEGQTEAASSLGMTRAQTLRLVVLPQAMRVIIPPTGNEVISMLKTTSLATTIGVVELLGAAGNISAFNFQTMALLIVAGIWYLMVTTVLSTGQFYVERHFARGALRSPPATPIQRLKTDLRGIFAKFRTRRPPKEAYR
jgi:polar amino acid transport system permease protein